ncbi:hypothetical protein ABFS83_14G263500 [Erythranthe nasuta]
MEHKYINMIVILTLLFSLASSSRTYPSMMKTSLDKAEFEGESCEGVGSDECLLRKTLDAHVDYIYTQSGRGAPAPHLA